jgi:hypothetical protein
MHVADGEESVVQMVETTVSFRGEDFRKTRRRGNVLRGKRIERLLTKRAPEVLARRRALGEKVGEEENDADGFV